MTYVLLTMILFSSMLLYFRIADHYNIIDKPNERSSHSHITIRGGGILFPIAVILWFFFFGMHYPWFTLGVILISTISFIDDRLTLSTKPRLAVHLLSVAIMLYELGFIALPWYAWLFSFVLVIGWLNAFNFMDGINGITAFYALSVLMPIAYINADLAFTEMSMIYVLGISILVFSWFNARKKAKTFAGDVGSISMGFVLAFLMISLILETQNWVYILFVAVYGIDAVLTILQRLKNGENIFKAHRSHLYQYLANEAGLSHLKVSAIYAIVQLGISSLVIFMILCAQAWWTFIVLLLGLGISYLLVKSYVYKKFVKV